MSAEKSPAAFARYRALVAESNQAPLVLRADLAFTDADSTWFELTELEAVAFEINPALHNALLFAYIRYTDMTGETDLEFSEFREDERAAFPEFFHEEAQESMDAAIRFMATACQLPATQTMAWMCRRQVQLVRSKLISDSWEAPAWALGDVAAPATPGEIEGPINRYDEAYWA